MARDDLRLTDKRMSDGRFRRTEEAILVAFMKNNWGSAGKIVKEAGIKRSTFYSHHKTVTVILLDYRKYIFKKYTKMMQRFLKKENISLKNVYFRLIMFVLANKKIFLMFLKVGDREVLNKMIDRMHFYIEREARLTKKQKRVFEICKAELVVLIEEWEAKGFREDRIDALLDNMIYLTRTAWTRLGATAE
jgi:AcrR family transcriptional regulator